MTLLNTHNQETTVSRSVHNYLIRKYCDSLNPKYDSPKGTIQAKEIEAKINEL